MKLYAKKKVTPDGSLDFEGVTINVIKYLAEDLDFKLVICNILYKHLHTCRLQYETYLNQYNYSTVYIICTLGLNIIMPVVNAVKITSNIFMLALLADHVSHADNINQPLSVTMVTMYHTLTTSTNSRLLPYGNMSSPNTPHLFYTMI